MFVTLFNMNWALTWSWACHVSELHFVPSLSLSSLVIGFGAFHLAFATLFPNFVSLDVFGWGGVRLHLRGSLGYGLVLDSVSTFDHLINIHFGPSNWYLFSWYSTESLYVLHLFWSFSRFVPRIRSTPHELSWLEPSPFSSSFAMVLYHIALHLTMYTRTFWASSV